MCANYEPAPPAKLAGFSVPPPDFNYGEAYPGSLGPFLANSFREHWLPGCFGLVPHWGKLTLARSTYNARSETVATKPSFRHAWKQKQLAVIPATAFYEPNYESGKPVRWRIERADGRPFGIAGIWERKLDDPGVAKWSFSMLTINATDHPLMKRFHAPDDEKRSVVVLDDDDWEQWLNARTDEDARSFLKLFDPDLLHGLPAPRGSRAEGRDQH